MEQLPDDLLADVLGRLPPSSLAASRCVRKHWRSLVDARRLLRADLLPLRLDAFFCISLGLLYRMTYLFARPAAARRRIPGGSLDFLEEGQSDLAEVEDSCNGLVLVANMVANPATQQWVTLPASPKPSISDVLGGVRVVLAAGTTTTTTTSAAADQEMNDDDRRRSLYTCSYLVYDPMAESPQHFEVFLVPFLAGDGLGRIRENGVVVDLEEQEWPPSTFTAYVFSSRRWRWEKRSWIRQGEPAGTMADMLLKHRCWDDHKGVYFRGALYVHYESNFVMRIALSNDKYQMVRSPTTLSKLGAKGGSFDLGKSEKGVYFALLYSVGRHPRFQVWLLKEEEEKNDDGHHHIHIEWVLKTNISLQPLLAKPPLLHSVSADDEWRMIGDYNNEEELTTPAAAHGDDEFVADDEWDFDNANVVLGEDEDNKPPQADLSYRIDFLGFHPHKEIVFFSLLSGTISYNLNTSKVQQLGDNVHIPGYGMRTCFPYTPCLLTMGKLFENS